MARALRPGVRWPAKGYSGTLSDQGAGRRRTTPTVSIVSLKLKYAAAAFVTILIGTLAVMGLLAFDDPNRESVRRGIEYLIRTQNTDGSWTELETTGTGFPKVFYLEYTYYRHYFPLLALGMYQRMTRQLHSRTHELQPQTA